MGGQAASPAKDIQLETCDGLKKAGQRKTFWDGLLADMGIQDAYEVRKSFVHGARAWGIYLHERTPGKRTARMAQLEALLHRMETGQRAG